MVWQDVFPNVGPKLDADHERERRLVEQARVGADWALAALIARYQPPVTRYLTRLTGSPTRARILAEHVFIRMERRLHGAQGGRQLRLWLLRACTEAGLEMLRGPRERKNPQLVESRIPAGLLPGGSSPAANFLRAGLGKLATVTGSTSRQVRKLIWSNMTENGMQPTRAHWRNGRAPAAQQGSSIAEVEEGESGPGEDIPEMLDPREALRHRMVRAVLAELPYGDAQCLALHLVAGLNQAEVALALGITASATRRRIVHGLTMFAQRYDAAAASLGLPLEFFDPQAGLAMQHGTRLDGTDRTISTVEAVNDDLEVDPLTTNEHIAVQPFTRDDAALIWSGRIHSEMVAEAEDATINALAEAGAIVVETSLAHVGEPVEIPDSQAAIPPPPDIPLTITDMWVHADAHEPVDDDNILSTTLALEEYIFPMRILDNELKSTLSNEMCAAEDVSDSSEAMVHPGFKYGDSVDVSTLVHVQMVPVLTDPMVFGAGREEVASAEHDIESSGMNTDAMVSTRAVPGNMRHGTRLIPVLTIGESLLQMHMPVARVVPVLTSSTTSEQAALIRALAFDGDMDARNDNGDRENPPATTQATQPPHSALVGRREYHE